MTIVIGLVGEPLAGKGTCAYCIEKLEKARGITTGRVRFSDLLRETLTLWDLPATRKKSSANKYYHA